MINGKNFDPSRTKYLGIGMMSGTSLDGLDLAAVEFVFDGGRWKAEITAAETVAYDDAWRERLATPPVNAEEYAKLDVDYGHWLGMQCRRFIVFHDLRPDFAASHGHTVFHRPERHFSAQIGDGETAATHLPCVLVTRFRNKDVALGGEGAPLVPFGETALFPEHRAFLNLGGIANLTLTDAQGTASRRDLVAFDVCACNLALNAVARRLGLEFDHDGQTAQNGRFLPDVFEALENLPYYRLPAPKSLDKRWVENEVIPLLCEKHRPEDLLHTFCT
ncbi:MAG: anhydro-N-acetylmuramic acid kinase, partial [Bacteroidia bacterium]|nr:anhydro-N-acetylmuramic acid kinase [Bacteroidia bacterium]